MDRFVLYLDIEHPLALLDRRKRNRHMRGVLRKSQILRDLSGSGCMSQSFIWLDGTHLEDLPLLAIVISGNTTDWEHYKPSQLKQPFEAIRNARVPVLGLCGGHQLVGKAFGGVVAPMRKLREDEADPYPQYRPGFFKEKGYTEVGVDVESPLFGGLGDKVVVSESHYCEIKRVPKTLEVIASNPDCRVQAVAHRDVPVYGVQFHPETFDEEHPDGKRILENFFDLAHSRS
jgi:GMP synthase-like glutamine amidotransferase